MIKPSIWAAVILAFLLTTFTIITHLYPRKYSQYVTEFSKEYGIDESLVYAIIKCESNFKPESVSHAGALGLMQITQTTFDWARQKRNDNTGNSISIYDTKTNIDYGCYIYSLFYNEFGDTKTALAAYNAGRTKVKNWLANKEYSKDGNVLNTIPFEETRNYVEKVIETQKIYKTIYRW